jgi:hypothetical protein
MSYLDNLSYLRYFRLRLLTRYPEIVAEIEKVHFRKGEMMFPRKMGLYMGPEREIIWKIRGKKCGLRNSVS